jgi:hypothetical protein
MQPAPGRPGLHSGLDSFCFKTNSSLSTLGSILWRNQCFLCRSASKYSAMQPRYCAVPVWRSHRCSPGVEFGSMHFTNRVQTYSSRLHQIASASGLVASSRSAAAGAGSSASTAGCLQAGLSRRGSRQAGPPSWLHVCDEVFG